MRLLGKFSNKHPEQIEKKFYSAGDEGNGYYGKLNQGIMFCCL